DNAEYNIESMTFLEAVTIIGSVYPPSEKFQSASRFAFRDFTSNERTELVDLIRKRSPGSVFAGISLYALGGRVSEIETDDTAFYYRNAKYIMWLETVWENPIYVKENREWIVNRFPYLEAITIGSYVNFPYKELYDYLQEYYGTHVRELKKIKKKYDPKNIFTFPQSIGRTDCCNDCPHYQLKNHMEGEINEMREENYRGFRYVSKR
ncbi:BBE domain-containing protein, partial [Anaerotignum propionicum]|uniref:BBE domain-containing protein n=1 Tax=Anaerotignum propionicum TaxID=28446 RepID=UPI00289DADCC